MPHLFLNTPSFNGDNRFYTNSAILHSTHYKPKVLIIGTYNEANVQGNLADFFYGRNYFWPVMYNLANNYEYGNINQLTRKRNQSLIEGAPNPTLNQILELCSQFELAFADLVQDVLVPLMNHNDSITFGCLRSPSGQGGFTDQAIMGGLIDGTARINAIARYWVWVNHPASPYGDLPHQNGYTHFNHNWLINAGVDPNLF